MSSEWFENDVFSRTVKAVLIDALNEREIDFYALDVDVQFTLITEASESGVQECLERFQSTKDTIEATAADQSFKNKVLTEIYRARGKANRNEVS